MPARRRADRVKVDILPRGGAVDVFSAIVHIVHIVYIDKVYHYGVHMPAKLRSLIPRQRLEMHVQAGIGSRIIARKSSRTTGKR